MTHLGGRLLAVSLIVGAISCGDEGPTDADRTVAWRLGIASQGDFGVRIWLDGEGVYSQTTAATQRHEVELERPYRSGEHVVEFEILAASSNPSTYTAAWTVQVKPSGPFFTADGVPTVLRIGERLTIRVPL